MKYLRNVFYLGILLLTLLAACGPVTATPAPTPVVVGPGSSSTLAAQAPLAFPPPVPSISNINSFCANQAAGLGGATWVQSPSVNDPSIALEAASINTFSKNPECTDDNNNKVTCSGPQNAKVTYQFCTTCGAPNSVVEPQADEATYGPYVCASGYVKDNSGGGCVPIDPNKPYYGICPSGSHYDNALQNCADDVTNALASPCPAGYPYYLPVNDLCLAKAYSIQYNCQSFT